MKEVSVPGRQTQGERVLSIMAHPDDAEIFCAGSLARLQDQGCEIHIVTMTPGDCGSMTLGASEIARVRRAEAAEAAARIRAKYYCLDYRDLQIFHDAATLKSVTEIVRRVDPSIVFTHPPRDYMPDHEATSLLVRGACFGAPAPNFDTARRPGAPAVGRIPHLYYASPAEGVDIFGREADYSVFIDISGVIGLKADMLACHRSQRDWLRARHGMDHYIEEMKRWAGEMGKRIGVEYAEGFLQHVGHAYPRDDRLAELLGGRRAEGALETR